MQKWKALLANHIANEMQIILGNSRDYTRLQGRRIRICVHTASKEVTTLKSMNLGERNYYQGHSNHPHNNCRNHRQNEPTVRQINNNYQDYNNLPQINHANQGQNEPTTQQSSPRTGQIRRQDSITELTAENYPHTIPRALSDSFLLTGRHPNMQANTHTTIKPKLVNLSSKEINEQAKQVLLKYGLKLTPVPKVSLIELRTDIGKFCHKLRLIEIFADKDMRKDDSLVAPESTFTPYQQRDTILGTNIDVLIKYPLEEMAQKQEKAKDNLNKAQWNGILNLKKDKTLVIKESDKGGACVIMNESFYHDKILEMLNDRETCKELDKNIYAVITCYALFLESDWLVALLFLLK